MTFNIYDIQNLSDRVSVLDFQSLLRDRRKDGFVSYVPDLKNAPATGVGWSITAGTGKLAVKDQHNTDELMNYIEDNLRHHAWFQTRAQLAEMRRQGRTIEVPQLPAGFEAYSYVFKSLGYWGKNPAMDIGTFIKNENKSLSAQMIIRQNDKKYAFVGGMIDKNVHEQKAFVIKKCQQEFLEEFYSNDLFSAGSETLRTAASTNPRQIAANLQSALADKEFEKLDEIKNRLQAIFNQDRLDFNSKMIELEKQLKLLGPSIRINKDKPNEVPKYMPAADLEVFWVRIKCRLYQEAFPAEYRDMCDFLENNLVQMPETINESDPRNTQTAFMTTIPHYLFIDKAELKQIQKKWKVEAKGGDDALSAKVISLVDIFLKPVYSAHRRIALDMLKHKAMHDPDFLNNPALQAQLEEIRQITTNREAVELGLVANQNGLALQQTNAADQHRQLATVTGNAELTQLNNVMSAADPNADQRALASSALDANQILKRKLGPVCYARMEEILEAQGLPTSARVVLAELCQYGSVNILLDNSGSMTQQYAGAGGATSRWQEAQSRLQKILPLLALAGVKVNLRLLNKHHGFTQQAYTFNFSANVGGNNVTVLENELQRTMSFLDTIFAVEPSGTTYVNDHLKAMFQAAPQVKNLNIFLTDGEANDGDTAILTIQQRNIEANPLVTVACTNQSREINWVRAESRKPNSGVVMLDDFATERSTLERMHGNAVPYSREIWRLLHLTRATVGSENCEGLHVYHLAHKTEEFSKDQLSELLGIDVLDADYEYYQYTRLQARQNQSVAMAVPVVAMVPSFNATPFPPYTTAPVAGNAPQQPQQGQNGQGNSIWNRLGLGPQ